jgi:transglutaminase superfamily protein
VVTVPADRTLIRERLTMRFTLRQKVGLAREILGSYLRQRRRMRGDDKLPTVLAELRRPLVDDGTERIELDDQLTGIRLGRAVSRTLAPVPDARCLMRSLVLVDLLARRGIAASFVLGVRSGPDFEAHAWVEKGGVALLPPYEGEYERLVDL